MTALEGKVVGAISRYSMLPAGTRLGVAVSGGADSVCLLHVLHRLHQSLTVIHINHHLRGAESDGDEAFVRELSGSLGLPVEVYSLELAPESNLEERARDGRRAIFHQLIRGGSLQRVALAHTRSDQAETVLFRLLRGAYTAGLAGMRPTTPAGLIRPMLDVTRQEVIAYLEERGLAWRQDSSNLDTAFSRNRIRHALLPQLEREWNPALSEILANHARLAQDDEDYWSETIQSLAPNIASDGSIILPLHTLAPLRPAAARRLAREVIRRVKGDLKRIDFRHIEHVLEMAAAPDGHGRVQLPGVDVMRSFDWLRFAVPRTGLGDDRDWELPLPVPGVAALPQAGGEIFAEVLEMEAVAPPHDTLSDVGLDHGRLPGGLVVRNWRPGDRYVRHGQSTSEKVKTMFHELRIPLWERRDWPMVCVADQIVWSRRFGPAAGFAATAQSPRVLRISERKGIGADGSRVE